MTASSIVDRDERTEAVENASYRWAYQFLSFGMVLIVAYRSLAYHESAWDLLGLVIAGGVVPIAYQASQQVLSRRVGTRMLTAFVVGLVVAVAVAALLLLRQR